MITLNNCREELLSNSVVVNETLFGDTAGKYSLVRAIDIQLSDGTIISIPKGFEHDKNSVLKVLSPVCIFNSIVVFLFLFDILPHHFLWIVGSFELVVGFLINRAFVATDLAAILHDYLYHLDYESKFADKEFLLWLNASHGTISLSMRNIAFTIFYYALRIKSFFFDLVR